MERAKLIPRPSSGIHLAPMPSPSPGDLTDASFQEAEAIDRYGLDEESEDENGRHVRTAARSSTMTTTTAAARPAEWNEPVQQLQLPTWDVPKVEEC